MGCEARTRHDDRRARATRSTWARTTDRTTVIVIDTDPHAWTEGGAWWEVGVPEVSERPAIREARAALDEAKTTAAERRLSD